MNTDLAVLVAQQLEVNSARLFLTGQPDLARDAAGIAIRLRQRIEADRAAEELMDEPF